MLKEKHENEKSQHVSNNRRHHKWQPEKKSNQTSSISNGGSINICSYNDNEISYSVMLYINGNIIIVEAKIYLHKIN